MAIVGRIGRWTGAVLRNGIPRSIAVSSSLVHVHAVHSLIDSIKNAIVEKRDKMTHERCIVELIVKNEEGRSKYVGDPKCSLAGDAVGLAKSIYAPSVVVQVAKGLMDSPIDHHTCVIHESACSRVNISTHRVIVRPTL